MNDYNQIANTIFQEFLDDAQAQGLTITRMDEETGGLYIPNAAGETMMVRLDNLIGYLLRNQRRKRCKRLRCKNCGYG
ncbi:MAG: hypothetical protein LBG19_08675 [Prevotellaceae bacterium]|nr:hypothetical protein [Prevotellaceae bacterium]